MGLLGLKKVHKKQACLKVVVNFVLWTTKVRKAAMASVVFVSRGILSGLAPSAQRQAIRVTSCRCSCRKYIRTLKLNLEKAWKI